MPGQFARSAAGSTPKAAWRASSASRRAATRLRTFEPFFTTKDVGKGTGLGLSQVYGFVRQAGGHAQIKSEPGAGTSVELYLPRSAERAVEARHDNALPLRRAASGEVVLVVEDEPAVLEMAVESLGELGYLTLTATRASAAPSASTSCSRTSSCPAG